MATTTSNTPSIAQLTENAARLLQESLAQASQAAGTSAAGQSPLDMDLARSNVRALAFVQGAGIYAAYRYLADFVVRQAVPVTAVGEYLDGWLATFGMTRKPAVGATGQVAGTGQAGAVLAAGAVLQTSDGRQYRTTVAAVVSTGGFSVPVVAVLAGTASNLGAGGEMALVSSVNGVDANCAAPGGLGGGAEAETDAQAAYRMQQRLSAEPMGGSPADYARWALSVPGITRAWGIRNISGPTTAGVIILADGNPGNPLPSEAQRLAVSTYIRDPRRGPPDELFVIVPTPVEVPLQIALQPDTPAIRAGVEEAFKDLFFREAVPGGSIPHSHLVEAVSAVVGEYNHTISQPALVSGAFFTVGNAHELLMPGPVTYL